MSLVSLVSPASLRYPNDLEFHFSLRNDAFVWMADQINEGVKQFKRLMDDAIATGNKQIHSAAAKVRRRDRRPRH